MKKTYIEIRYKNKKFETKEIENRTYQMQPNILCFRYYDQNKLGEKINITKWIYNAKPLKLVEIKENNTNQEKEKLLYLFNKYNTEELYKIDNMIIKKPNNSTTYNEYYKKTENRKKKQINNTIKNLEKNINNNIKVTYIFYGNQKTITGKLEDVIDYYGIKIDTYTLPFIDENIIIIEIRNELNQKIYNNQHPELPIEIQKENIFGSKILQEEETENRKAENEWKKQIDKIPNNELEKIKIISQGAKLIAHNKQDDFINLINIFEQKNNGLEYINFILTTINQILKNEDNNKIKEKLIIENNLTIEEALYILDIASYLLNINYTETIDKSKKLTLNFFKKA